MSILAETAFELGKVLLKVELSKHETGDILRAEHGDCSERILLQRIGKFWNQQNAFDRPDGLVVVTDRRLAFLAKVKSATARTDFLSFPFAAVCGLKAVRVMGISPAIEFMAAGRRFVFTLFDGSAEIVAAIEGQRAA